MRTHLMRRALLTSVMLFAGWAVTAVVAQDQAEFSSWRLPGWSVTPGLAASVVFDSNVALANAPADTQQTVGDHLFAFQPFGQLDYFSPRTEFSGGYRGYVRRYADLQQLNGFDQRGYVTLRRLATKRLTF